MILNESTLARVSTTNFSCDGERSIIQPRAEPLFGFGDGLGFAGGVVGHLVFAEFADGEVF